MGDVSTEVLRGAVDEVLAILKTENQNDSQKKSEIESILDRLTDETFNHLMVLGQQMVDYDPEDEYRGEQREEEIEVNVELDEEDEDDEGQDIVEVKGADDEDRAQEQRE